VLVSVNLGTELKADEEAALAGGAGTAFEVEPALEAGGEALAGGEGWLLAVNPVLEADAKVLVPTVCKSIEVDDCTAVVVGIAEVLGVVTDVSLETVTKVLGLENSGIADELTVVAMVSEEAVVEIALEDREARVEAELVGLEEAVTELVVAGEAVADPALEGREDSFEAELAVFEGSTREVVEPELDGEAVVTVVPDVDEVGTTDDEAAPDVVDEAERTVDEAAPDVVDEVGTTVDEAALIGVVENTFGTFGVAATELDADGLRPTREP
jgi:hypothetical protein